jgi:hypothetical protein
MDWLFELSAACALVALALPFAWKFLSPQPMLQPARARVRTTPARLPSADQDFHA